MLIHDRLQYVHMINDSKGKDPNKTSLKKKMYTRVVCSVSL